MQKTLAKTFRIKELAKKNRATDVEGDPAFDGKLTENAQRFWRQHRMLYSKRVFVAPGDGEGDVGWWLPQWIGNRETNVLDGQQYPLRGFYLPNDEEALDYYALRRMEANHPVIGRLPNQSKSSGSSEASPHEPLNTGSARSKMGNFPTSMSRTSSQDSLWSNWSSVAGKIRPSCSKASVY
jgi:hypothetical protein